MAINNVQNIYISIHIEGELNLNYMLTIVIFLR